MLVVLAFSLRISNVTLLDPYTDENPHLVGGKSVLESGAPHVPARTENGFREYDRSYFVTLAVAGSYQVGEWTGTLRDYNDHLFWGRLPGVVFGSLAVIPLYLFARRIHSYVGFISAFLWAVSPWAIGISQAVREYAFASFLVLSYLLVLLAVLESARRHGLTWGKRMIGSLIVILGGAYYALIINEKATLKIGLFIAGLMLLFYGIYYAGPIKRWLVHKGSVVTVAALALVGGGIMAGLGVLARSGQTVINPAQMTFTSDWMLYFFRPQSVGKPIMWWYEADFIPFFVPILICVALIYAVAFKKKYALLTFFICVGMFVFYVFVFDRYTKPRYISYLLPFFSILSATGLFAFYRMSGKISMHCPRISAVVVVLACSSMFLYSNTIYAITSSAERYVKTTGEYHDNFTNVMQFFRNEASIQDTDVFITTSFHTPLRLAFDIPNQRIFKYGGIEGANSKERFVHTANVIDTYKQGYLILDWRRNHGNRDLGFPTHGEFWFGDTWMNVVFRDANFSVYRWDHEHQAKVIEPNEAKKTSLPRMPVYHKEDVGDVPLYDDFYPAERYKVR